MTPLKLFAASLALTVGIFASHAQARPLIPAERMAIIDAHALAAPAQVESSPERLAAYFSAAAANDAEKARAIFRWIADRIDYDVQAYLADNIRADSVETVMQSRTGVCDGYARLFETLARHAGLQAVSIQGYAKAYGHKDEVAFDKRNHAWNAVRVNGQWRLLDPTWGAGAVRNGRYEKGLREVYFMANPEQLAFSHLPVDSNWQMQSTPRLTKTEFEALPRLEPAFFNLGISGMAVWRTLQEPAFDRQFVRTFDVPYGWITVKQAPLSLRLSPSGQYDFAIESDDLDQVAVIDNNDWTYLQKVDGAYRLQYAPKGAGELSVAARRAGDARFTTFLQYRVD